MSALPLNFNRLYYFFIVAREGSLVKASKVLDVSPPSISEQIKKLETELGESLFERQAGRLRLNEFGRRTFRHAAEMFRIGEDFAQELEGNTDPRLVLRSGACPAVTSMVRAHYFLPLFSNPEVMCCLRHSDHQTLSVRLVSGDLELAFLGEATLDWESRGLESELISEDVMVMVGPKNSRISSSFQTLAYRRGTRLRLALDVWANEKSYDLHVVGEVDSPDVMAAAVEADGFTAFVPERLAEEWDMNVLERTDTSTQVYGVYRNQTVPDRIKHAVLSLRDREGVRP